MLKQKKGITLIALVITIIVLLILAGVSISAVMGENGIATKAKEAKEETRAGEVQEVIDLWKTEVSAKELDKDWGDIKGEDDVLQELLDSGKVEESEINRTKKTITIGSRVINYSTEVYNPYEIQPHQCRIMLYNKDTGEYEWFGERVQVYDLYNGENLIFDGDVTDKVRKNNATYPGYNPPQGTPVLYCHFITPNQGPVMSNARVVVYKDGIKVIYEGPLTILDLPM